MIGRHVPLRDPALAYEEQAYEDMARRIPRRAATAPAAPDRLRKEIRSPVEHNPRPAAYPVSCGGAAGRRNTL
ncbi:hypothetical protein GCM10010377_24380 [Streptomyces viridiviolaceus]|nr:hypothetical protein GCM10010377_24380 [Streptomyces viridiviolaceus]